MSDHDPVDRLQTIVHAGSRRLDLTGFRTFVLRGNVVDLAVGIVIGAAFTSVVRSFVDDLMTPLIGIPLGNVSDFSTRYYKVCVVSQQLAEIVLPGQDPVGQSIRVGELTFTIIGVFRERIDTFGQSEIHGDSLLVPFPLIRYYTGDISLESIYVQANRPENVQLLNDRVSQLLKSRHRPKRSTTSRICRPFWTLRAAFPWR